MNETREQLLDNVVRKFGHEDENTITFAELCECEKEDKYIIWTYNVLMSL